MRVRRVLLQLALVRRSFGTLHTVRWRTADGTRVIEGVSNGELLRTLLLKRGVSPHNGRSQVINCRGLGTCGTCAVEVAGPVSPAERTQIEDARLNFPPHGRGDPTLRLACQVRVEGDLEVTKRAGFWGARAELAPAAAGRPVLGDLEFLLDSTAAETVCGVCQGTELVPCPLCAGADRSCSACRGSGQVPCRSCYKLDPFDLDAARRNALRRPD